MQFRKHAGTGPRKSPWNSLNRMGDDPEVIWNGAQKGKEKRIHLDRPPVRNARKRNRIITVEPE